MKLQLFDLIQPLIDRFNYSSSDSEGLLKNSVFRPELLHISKKSYTLMVHLLQFPKKVGLSQTFFEPAFTPPQS